MRIGLVAVQVPILGLLSIASAPAQEVAIGVADLVSRPAKLVVRQVSISRALTELQTTAGVSIVFSPDFIPGSRLVTCACETVSVGAALNRLLAGTGLQYQEMRAHILVELSDPHSERFNAPSPIPGPAQQVAALAVVKLSSMTGAFGSRAAESLGLALQAEPIAGTVVDDRADPIAGAQISVVGTRIATTTDGRGRFRIDSVPGVSVTLRASAIGYQPVTLTTRPGATDITITMAGSPFALTDVVVTGTAGGQEKRSIGNAVTKLQAAEIQAIAPAADLSGLLNGRATNVVLQAVSGAVGSGGRLRVRGASSLSLNNQPLVYVDGVRADNSNNSSFNFRSTNRLNDLDPSQIESIEIIRGPAASTLYGTEATNGVIQIITKKGTQGKGQIGVETGLGVSWMWDPESLFDKSKSYYRVGGEIRTLNLVRQETDAGREVFRNAQMRRYAVDMRGGTQALQYYFNASFHDEDGVVAPNTLTRWSGRANIQAAVNENLSISFTGGYIASKTSLPPIATVRSLFAPFPASLGTPQRGFFDYPPEVARVYLSHVEDVSRVTAGVELTHTPARWFSHRAVVGVDDINEASDNTNPFLTGFAASFFTSTAALGRRTVGKREPTQTTVDYSGTATKALSSKIGTRTSIGAQFYRRFTKTALLTGIGFPAPGVATISSAATRSAEETFVENKTIGFYAQEQLSYNDRFFLTGAVRADDNSAFGAEFDLVTYPKISAAWVVSDEPFWGKKLVSTLRLRGAYGQSGQQPDQFAALQSFQAVPGAGGSPAVRPQFFGNPELGPERGVELELGFEAGLFGDRLGIDFTFFDKRTKDAILAKSVAPSGGFGLGAQFVNIGEVLNRGWELQVTGTPLSARNVKLDLSFALSHTRNEILDMGGAGDITGIAINQRHRQGFPVAAFFYKRVVSAELDANGVPTNLMCDAGVDNGHPGGAPVPCATAPVIYGGHPLPRYEGALNTTLQLFRRLTVSGLVDFKTGGRNFTADLALQCQIQRACEANLNPATDLLGAADMLVNAFGVFSTPEVRYIKIRQVSASYRVPDRWARLIGGTSAAITLAARNLHTFTNFKLGPDPELGSALTQPQNAQLFSQVPIPVQFLTTIRVTF